MKFGSLFVGVVHMNGRMTQSAQGAPILKEKNSNVKDRPLHEVILSTMEFLSITTLLANA